MDLRPYAERLAKAMPERFELVVELWCLNDLVNCITLNSKISERKAWAFFGPLLDEFEVETIAQETDELLTPEGWKTTHREPWIEAVAVAVCEAVEARGEQP